MHRNLEAAKELYKQWLKNDQFPGMQDLLDSV